MKEKVCPKFKIKTVKKNQSPKSIESFKILKSIKRKLIIKYNDKEIKKEQKTNQQIFSPASRILKERL